MAMNDLDEWGMRIIVVVLKPNVLQKKDIHDLWMELAEGVETSDGMDMLENIKEEKLHIVADMSARKIAEGKQRQGMGSSESYFIYGRHIKHAY